VSPIKTSGGQVVFRAPEATLERDRGEVGERREEPFGRLLSALETSVTTACERHAEWPEKVAAGIYAGVDFAIDNPAVIDAVTTSGGTGSAWTSGYEGTVQRLAKLISEQAPAGSRLPGSTDEALVAGIIGLVGDHVRVGRTKALADLRPDLVLLALLPYLGFDEARRRANELPPR
jgi:hypothetical protein